MLTFQQLVTTRSTLTQLVVLFFWILNGQVASFDLFEGSACRLKNGTVGVCTKLPECESLYNGLTRRTIPYSSVVRCSFVGSTEVVCCGDRKPDKNFRSSTVPSLPDQIIFNSTSSTGTNMTPDTLSCSENTSNNGKRVNNLPGSTCGGNNPEKSDEIESRFGIFGIDININLSGKDTRGQNSPQTQTSITRLNENNQIGMNTNLQQLPPNDQNHLPQISYEMGRPCIVPHSYNVQPPFNAQPLYNVQPPSASMIEAFSWNNAPSRTTTTTVRPRFSSLFDVLNPIKEAKLGILKSITNTITGQKVDNSGRGFDNSEFVQQSQHQFAPLQQFPQHGFPIQGNSPMSYENNPISSGFQYYGNDKADQYYNAPNNLPPQTFSQQSPTQIELHNQQIISDSRPVNGQLRPEFGQFQNQHGLQSQQYSNIPLCGQYNTVQNFPAIQYSQTVPSFEHESVPSSNQFNLPSHGNPDREPGTLRPTNPNSPVIQNPQTVPSFGHESVPSSNQLNLPSHGNPNRKPETFRPTNSDYNTDSNPNFPQNNNQFPPTAQVTSRPIENNRFESKDQWNTAKHESEVIIFPNDSTLKTHENIQDEVSRTTPKSTQYMTTESKIALDPWMKEALSLNQSSSKEKATTPTPSEVSNNNSNLDDDDFLDEWMKEALEISSNGKDIETTSKKTFSQQSMTLSSPSNITSDSDNNTNLDPWMKEALQYISNSTTHSSNSLPTPTTTEKSDLNAPAVDAWIKDTHLYSTPKTVSIPKENFTNNHDSETVHSNPILDPWMKEALLQSSKSEKIVESPRKTDSLNYSHLEKTTSIVNGTTFNNHTLDPWMKDALQSSVDADKKPKNTRTTKTELVDRSDRVPQRLIVQDPSSPVSSTTNNDNFYFDQMIHPSSPTNLTEDVVFNFWEKEVLKVPEITHKNQSNPLKNLGSKSTASRNFQVVSTQPRPPSFIKSHDYPDYNEISSDNSTSSGGHTTEPQTRGSGHRKADIACATYRNISSGLLTFHILRGTNTTLGEFPHMAALGFPSIAAGQDIDWSCGGSLISDRYILTAAHCITRFGPTKIRLGKITIDSNLDGADPVDVDVDDSIPYPKYTNSRQYNDIALIRMKEPVEFTENVRPACLNTETDDLPPDTTVVVTGWGTVSLKTREKSSILLKANLTTVNLSSCNQSHADYGYNRKLPNGLSREQFCAFDPELNKDACQGDSGGPLQLVDKSRTCTIYGVTSFGIGCATKIPGVYAKVSSYLDWIEEVVWPS